MGLKQETKRLARVATEAKHDHDKLRRQWRRWREDNGELKGKHKRLEAETLRLLKLNKAMRGILEREIIRREDPSPPPPEGAHGGDGDGKSKKNNTTNRSGGDGAAKGNVVDSSIVGSSTSNREEAIDLAQESATLFEALQSITVSHAPPPPPPPKELAQQAVGVGYRNSPNCHRRRRDREYSSADEVATPRVSTASAGTRGRGRSVEEGWRAADKSVEGARSMTRRERRGDRVPPPPPMPREDSRDGGRKYARQEEEEEEEEAELLHDSADPRGCIKVEEPARSGDNMRVRVGQIDGYGIGGNGDERARVRGLFWTKGENGGGVAGGAAAGSGGTLSVSNLAPPAAPSVAAGDKGIIGTLVRGSDSSNGDTDGGHNDGGVRDPDGNGDGSVMPAELQSDRTPQRAKTATASVTSIPATSSLDRRSNEVAGSLRRRAQPGSSSSGRKRSRLELDEQKGGDIVVTEVPEAPRQRSARRAAGEPRRETGDKKLGGGVSVKGPSSRTSGGGVGQGRTGHGSDTGVLPVSRASPVGTASASGTTRADRSGFQVQRGAEGGVNEGVKKQQQRGLSCGVEEQTRSTKPSSRDKLQTVGRHIRNKQQGQEEQGKKGEARQAPPRSGDGQSRTPTGRGGLSGSTGSKSSRSTSNERQRDPNNSRGHLRPRHEGHTSSRRKPHPPLEPSDGGNRAAGAGGGGGVASEAASVSTYPPLAMATVSPKKSSRFRRPQYPRQQQQQQPVESVAGGNRSSNDTNNSSGKNGSHSPDAAGQGVEESNQATNPTPKNGHGRRRMEHRSRATVGGGDDGWCTAPAGTRAAIGAATAPGPVTDGTTPRESRGRTRRDGDGFGSTASSSDGDGGKSVKVRPGVLERPARQGANVASAENRDGTGKVGGIEDTRLSAKTAMPRGAGGGASRMEVENPYGCGGFGGDGRSGRQIGTGAPGDLQRPPKMHKYQEVRGLTGGACGDDMRCSIFFFSFCGFFFFLVTADP